MLQLAFDKVAGRNDLARKYACDPTHVRRVRCMVAEALVRHQASLSDALMTGFHAVQSSSREAKKRFLGVSAEEGIVLSYTVAALRWDETQQTFYLPVENLPPGEATTWPVFFARKAGVVKNNGKR